MSTIEKFAELVAYMEQMLPALRAIGFGGAVDVEFEGEMKPSLEKRFAQLLDESNIDLSAGQALLNEMLGVKSDVLAARDAVVLSKYIWPTTAAGMGNGVAGITDLVAGAAGTNGTYVLGFSGGTQVLAPQGYFVVTGGVVIQVVITYPGYYSAGTPTLSFAACPGLTGASATTVMAPNSPVGGYFSQAVSGAPDVMILYQVAAGPIATEVGRISSANIRDMVLRIYGRGAAYPFLSAVTKAQTGGDQAVFDRVMKGVLDVKLYGVSTSDSYYLERVRRNVSGSWMIAVARASDNAVIARYSAALTEPADPTQAMVVPLTGVDVPAAYGFVLIRWSEFVTGVASAGWAMALSPDITARSVTTSLSQMPVTAARLGHVCWPSPASSSASIDEATRTVTWPALIFADGRANSSGRISLAAGSMTFDAPFQVAWLDLEEAASYGAGTVPAAVVRKSTYTKASGLVGSYEAGAHQFPLAWSTGAGHVAVNPLIKWRNPAAEAVAEARTKRASWQIVGSVTRLHRDVGTQAVSITFGDLRAVFGTGVSSKTIAGVTALSIPQGRAAYVDLDAPLNEAGKLDVLVTPAGYTAVGGGLVAGSFVDDRRIYLLINDQLGLSGSMSRMLPPPVPANFGQVWLKVAPCNVTWNASTRTLAWDNYLIAPMNGGRVRLAPGEIAFTTDQYQVAYIDVNAVSLTADTPASAVHVGAYHIAADADRYQGFADQIPLFYWASAADYGALGGFPRVIDAGSTSAGSPVNDDDVVVKVGAGAVSIFVKGARAGSRYLEQTLTYSLIPAMGTGTDAGNADLWRLGACYEAVIEPATTNFTRGNSVLNGGEIECAILENGAADYIGGVHGDERLVAMALFVDGRPVALDAPATIIGREVQYVQRSTLYRCNTTTDEAVAAHVKDVTISRQAGAMELRLRQYVEWQKALAIKAAMLTMLPIKRLLNDSSGPQVTDRAMRAPLNVVEDVSVAGFAQIVTAGDLPKAKVWGSTSGISAEVEILAAPANATRSYYVANSPFYNKLYYSMAGNILQGLLHNTVVGERWVTDSRLRIRTTN